MARLLEPLRRIAAYGICRNDDDQVLLVRASARSGTPGAWSLPGGAVAHGENPKDTVVRETAAETGLSVAVSGLQDVGADMRALPDRGITIHTDRLHLHGPRPRRCPEADRVDQPTDLVPLGRAWPKRGDAAAAAVHRGRARPAAGRGRPAARTSRRTCRRSLPYPGPDGLHRAQRFAAYAVATDPAGRVLLTRIADGYPGAGRWHLPGGGTDFGETPGPALLRELRGGDRPARPAGRAARRGQPSRRRPIGPEGYPIDWHGVRAFYLVQVDDATAPTVHDVGGSTVEARWFTPAEVDAFRSGDVLTEVTVEALAALPRQRTALTDAAAGIRRIEAYGVADRRRTDPARSTVGAARRRRTTRRRSVRDASSRSFRARPGWTSQVARAARRRSQRSSRRRADSVVHLDRIVFDVTGCRRARSGRCPVGTRRPSVRGAVGVGAVAGLVEPRRRSEHACHRSRPPTAAGSSKVQRFSAYGLVTDPADRILLTRISDGYPGAGTWHLPGGGTDFGERPAEAL